MGQRARDIIQSFSVTQNISDDDLRILINWYKDLIGFYETESSTFFTGLLIEQHQWVLIAQARGWDYKTLR